MIRHGFGSRIFSRLVAAALALGAADLATASQAHADVGTISSDAGISGWDRNEPNLSSGAVSGGDRGQLCSTSLAIQYS